jgi:hypothetical protein
MSASKPIYVDPETFDALKLRAKPFETPNAVLRLPTNKTKRGRPKGSKNRKGVEPV